MNSIYGFGILLLTLTSSYGGAEPIGKIQTEKAHKLKLPPCRACKAFVDSFHKVCTFSLAPILAFGIGTSQLF